MTQPDIARVASQPYLRPAERFIILVSAIPSSLLYTIMTPVIQKMQTELATGPDDAMLLRVALTVGSAATMIGAPIAGWIIDRIGVRLLMIGVVLLFAGFGSLVFVIHDLHVLIAARFIQGLAVAGSLVTGTTLLGKIPDEVGRGRLMGLVVMTGGIAGVFALMLAGVVGDIGWRYTFLLHLLYLPLIGCAVLLSGKESVVRKTVAAVDGFWQKFPYGLALITFMAGLVTYSGNAYMPFRYHDIGVEKSALVGIALTAQNIALSVGAGLFGLTRRWLSAAGSFKASFTVAAVGAVLSVIFHDYWMTTAGQLIYGLGLAGMVPNIFALAAAAPSEIRGRTTGTLKALFSASPLLMTIVLEPVMRQGGAAAVMMTVAALSLATTIGIAIGWTHGRAKAQTPQDRPLAQAGEA